MASRKPKKVKSAVAIEASASTTDQEPKTAAPTASIAKKKARKKAATRRVAKPKRRGPGRPKGSKNKTQTALKPVTKKSTRPRRYTPAERAKILATAKREGLSGVAAAKKFGISQLTYYTWRKKAGTSPAKQGRRSSAAAIPTALGGEIEGLVRREVRTRLSQALPAIVAEEIQAAFGAGRSRR